MDSRTFRYLCMQLSVLRRVAEEYPGKTIENIIQQMDARLLDDDERIYNESIKKN